MYLIPRMKWVRLFGGIGMISASFGLGAPAVAQAQSEVAVSGGVTLSATVEVHRGIIVDNTGSIIEIFSNTDNPVTPTVNSLTYGGTKLPLTANLARDYDQLMSQVKDNRDLIIVRAKTLVPTNFVDPDANILYVAAPAASTDDPSHTPYFIDLGQVAY